MVLKIIVLVIAILVAIKFFDILKNRSEKAKRKNEQIEESTFVECQKCGTFIDSNEAIVSSKGYFCSQKCMDEA